jgi:hypothetical protein
VKAYKIITVGIASTIMIACTATAEKPSTDAPEIAQDTAKEVKPLIAVPRESASNQIAQPSNISALQGQITALQEQVIKLSSDSASILKLSQLLVAKAQVQAVSSNQAAKPIAKQASYADDGSLKTVLKKLESISPSPKGAFGIVSSYTASKQWVLIRFDRQSGETWLADNDGWNMLAESSELEISQYDVHLIRADQDKKGYVASRIDQRTGETWWLNKKQWVVYQ